MTLEDSGYQIRPREFTKKEWKRFGQIKAERNKLISPCACGSKKLFGDCCALRGF